MGFYDELSKYYSYVFPLKLNKVDFIEKNIYSNKLIVDVACADGNEAIELSKRGYKVEAFDLDETMINKGIEKIKKEKIKCSFNVLDMREIKKKYADNTVGNVLCTGNSIVHLNNVEEIEDNIKSFYDVLEMDGKLIIQIINYDRIIKHNIKSLPTITNDQHKVKFERYYEYVSEKNKVLFKTMLYVKDKIYKNAVSLVPLNKNQLESMLTNAGFREMTFYSSFDGEYYNEEGYATIVVATK